MLAAVQPPPDEQLVAQAQAGDRDAFARLLALVQPELEVFLRLHGAARYPSRESLADVVQSVFAECIEHVDAFAPRGDGSFRAWLRQVALHKLISKRRYHGAAARDPTRERPAAAGSQLLPFADSLHQLPTPSQAAIGREEAELLERSLAELPEEQRQVVTMARLFSMPHAEIAAVLGKSEPACRMLLKRGLARLTAIMVGLAGEGGPGSALARRDG